MNNFNKLTSYALYLVLPFIFFTVVHLLFSYAQWDLNPINWSELTRGLCAILGIAGAAFGGLATHLILDSEKH